MKKTITSKHGEVISKHLTNIRKKSGLTQRELAQKLKREHSFVANCERGQRRVDLAEFYWICKACEVTPHREVVILMKAFEKL